MPATAANIALATREAEIDTRSDAAVLTAHPNARGTADEPRVAFWDAVADAATVNQIGFDLIKAARRRGSVVVFDEIDFSGTLATNLVTPTVTVVDVELVLNTAMLTSRIEVDEEAGITTLEVYG